MPIFVNDSFDAVQLAEACVAAGANTIEITCRRENVTDEIKRIRKTFPDLTIMVGSIVDEGPMLNFLKTRRPDMPSLDELSQLDVDGFVSMMPISLKTIEKSQRDEYELASAIMELIKRDMVVGGDIVSQVHHVSNSYDLWKLNIDFLFETNFKDVNGNLIGVNTKIDPTVELTNSIIGPNSEIGKNVKLEKTVVLPNSLVNISYKNSLVLSEHVETFME